MVAREWIILSVLRKMIKKIVRVVSSNFFSTLDHIFRSRATIWTPGTGYSNNVFQVDRQSKVSRLLTWEWAITSDCLRIRLHEARAWLGNHHVRVLLKFAWLQHTCIPGRKNIDLHRIQRIFLHNKLVWIGIQMKLHLEFMCTLNMKHFFQVHICNMNLV